MTTESNDLFKRIPDQDTSKGQVVPTAVGLISPRSRASVQGVRGSSLMVFSKALNTFHPIVRAIISSPAPSTPVSSNSYRHIFPDWESALSSRSAPRICPPPSLTHPTQCRVPDATPDW